ncbi:uncharacterized protein LOC142341629 [Convolutriloba macropyga]|uniref:uncharacterized protein LOC142341629 n=1 Tax=Convolutriloba macropyga TaxID=536237 RepID=UPI003F520994
MSQLSQTSKEFLTKLSELSAKCDQSQQEERCEKEPEADELNVVVDFFVHGDGKKFLSQISECLYFGQNVSITSELVEVLLEIVSELLSQVLISQAEALQNEDSSVDSFWERLPVNLFDSQLISFVLDYLIIRSEEPKKCKKRKLSKLEDGVRARNKKIEAEFSTDDEISTRTTEGSDAPRKGNLRRQRKVSGIRKRDRSKTIRNAKESSYNFATLPLPRQKKASVAKSEHVSSRTSVAFDEFDGRKLSSYSVDLPKYRSTSVLSNGIDESSRTGSCSSLISSEVKVPRRIQIVETIDQKLANLLQESEMRDSRDVISAVLMVVTRLLFHEFVSHTSIVRPLWRAVLKWCSKTVRINCSSKSNINFSLSRFNPLFSIDFLCSFMVLNLAIFSYVFGNDHRFRRVHSKSEGSLIAEVEATFTEVVSAVTRAHQLSLGNVEEQFVIDRLFGCSWRSLTLFGFLWDKNRDLLKHMTKRSSAPLITNSSTIKQMVLLKRIDLSNRDYVDKIVCVIKCLGSENVNNDHSTSCPFKVVLDLVVSCLPVFLESGTHFDVVATLMKIKLCSCQQLESNLGFLEEFLKRLSKYVIVKRKGIEQSERDESAYDEDNRSLETVIAFMTKITCHPENRADTKFKFYKRILQKTNEKVPRQCLQTYVLRSLEQFDFTTENLFALCSVIHVPALRFLKEKLTRYDIFKKVITQTDQVSQSFDLTKSSHLTLSKSKLYLPGKMKKSIWSEDMDKGKMPFQINKAARELPLDLFHYLLKFTQLALNYFKSTDVPDLNRSEKAVIEILGNHSLFSLQLDTKLVEALKEKNRSTLTIDLNVLQKLKEKSHRILQMSESVAEMLLKSLESKSVVMLMFCTHNCFKPALFAAQLIQTCIHSHTLSGKGQTEFVSNVLKPLSHFCEQFNVGYLCFSKDLRKLVEKLRAQEKHERAKTSAEKVLEDIDDIDPDRYLPITRNESECSEGADICDDYELIKTPETQFIKSSQGLKRESTLRKRTIVNVSLEGVVKATNKFVDLELLFEEEGIASYFEVLSNCFKLFHEFLALESEQIEACGSQEIPPEKVIDVILSNVAVLLFALPKIDSSCDPEAKLTSSAFQLLTECLNVICCCVISNRRKFENSSIDQLTPAFIQSINSSSSKLAFEIVRILWRYTFPVANCEKRHELFGNYDRDEVKNPEVSEDNWWSSSFADTSGGESQSDPRWKKKTGSGSAVHIFTCDPCEHIANQEYIFNPEVLPTFLRVVFSVKSPSVLKFYLDKLSATFRTLKPTDLLSSQVFIYEKCDMSISALAKPLFVNPDLVHRVLEPLLNFSEVLSKDYVLPNDLSLFFRLLLDKSAPKSKVLSYFEQVSNGFASEPNVCMLFESEKSRMFEIVVNQRKELRESPARDLNLGFSCAFWIKFVPVVDEEDDRLHCFDIKTEVNVHIFTFSTIRSKVSFFLKREDETVNGVKWFLIYFVSKIQLNVLPKDKRCQEVQTEGKVELAPEFEWKANEWLHVFFTVDKLKVVHFAFNGMLTAKCEPPPSEKYSLSDSPDLVVSFGAQQMPSQVQKTNNTEQQTSVQPKISTGSKADTKGSFKDWLKFKYTLHVDKLQIYNHSPSYWKKCAMYMWLGGPKGELSNRGQLKLQPEKMLTRVSTRYYRNNFSNLSTTIEEEFKDLMDKLILEVDPKSGFITVYDEQPNPKEFSLRTPSSYPFPAHVTIQNKLTFEKAIETLGGPYSLIYFFAKIVEDSTLAKDATVAESEQRRTLSIVLKFFASRALSLCNLRSDENVLNALEPILASPKCIFSEKLVSCFVESAIQFDTLQGSKSSQKVEYIIRNVEMVLMLFKHKSLWTVERTEVLKFYVAQIEKCIKQQNSALSSHNRRLLNDCNILEHCITLIWNWSSNFEMVEMVDCLVEFLVSLLLLDTGQVVERGQVEEIQKLICQLHPGSNLFVHHAESAFNFLDRTQSILSDMESSLTELSERFARGDIFNFNEESPLFLNDNKMSPTVVIQSPIDLDKSREGKSDVMTQFLDDVTRSISEYDVNGIEVRLGDSSLRDPNGNNTIVFDSGNETGGTEATFKFAGEGSSRSCVISETMLKLIQRLYTPLCLSLDFSDLANRHLVKAPKYWAVLFNNNDHRISTALLNLIRKVYEVTEPGKRDDFLREKLFHIISSQLYISRQVSEDLIHSALALFFASQEAVNFLNFPDVEPKMVKNWISKQIQSTFHLESFPILLTLYLNCANSYANSQWHCDMANSLISLFTSVFIFCKKSRDVMLKFGVIPAVLNASVEIFQRHTAPLIQQLLIKNITEFLGTIAEFTVLSPDESKERPMFNLLRHLIDSICLVWNRVAKRQADDYLNDQMNILIFQMFAYVLKVALQRLSLFKTFFSPPSPEKSEKGLSKMLSFKTSKSSKPNLLQKMASRDQSSDTESITSLSDSRTSLKLSSEDLLSHKHRKSSGSQVSVSSSSYLFRSPKTSLSISASDLFIDFKEEPRSNTLFMQANDINKLLSQSKIKSVVTKLKFILVTMKNLTIFSLPAKLSAEQHKADWCFKYHDFVEFFIKKLRELLNTYLSATTSSKWVRLLKDLRPHMVKCVEQITHILVSPDYCGPIQTLPLLFYTDHFFEAIVKAVYGCLSSSKEGEDLILNNATKHRLDLVCNQCRDISNSHRKVIRRLELSIPQTPSQVAQQKLLMFPQSSMQINGSLQRTFSIDRSADYATSMTYDETRDTQHSMSPSYWPQKRALWIAQVSETKHRWDPIYDDLQDDIIRAAIAVEALSKEWLETQTHFLKLKNENLENIGLLAFGVNEVTHPGAVWFEASKGAQFWQLDQTEGPLRTKRRLESCMLNVHRRHLRSSDRSPPREDLTHTITDGPLSCSSILNERTGYLDYIFSRRQQRAAVFSLSSFSTAKRKEEVDLEQEANLGILAIHRCSRILPYCEIWGDVLISRANLFFWPDNSTALSSSNFNSALIGSNSSEDFKWPYTSIREVHERLYSLKDCATEIFFTTGLSCMLSFDDPKTRNLFHQQLLEQNLPNLVKGKVLEESMKAWTSDHMTNFAYLTAVNKYAGRSSNDLMQYPVFPFVLCDYDSSELNLQNPSVYRDLSKPVSVQKPEKEEMYEKKYKEMMNNEFSGPTDFGPYHYSSLYSNSGIVLHYLVRLLPFARMFLHYQGDSFDIPDRTFFDISSTWKLAAHTSMTDVKELIPEFFYLPEFLLNKTNFDFGERQDKQIVHNVKLPPWCLDDPRLFILVHRQALESAFVSKHLQKWIDLIFGCKQTGKAAIEAHNVYRPCLYYGFNLDQISDPQSREAVERMIRTYGQTPKQIFKNAHSSRGRNPGAQILDFKLMDFVFGGALGMVTISDDNLEKLNPKKPSSPLPSVFGLKWGNYCGSPALREPTECWSNHYRPPIFSIGTMEGYKTVGIPINSVLLHRREKDLGIHEENESSENSHSVTWRGVLKFGFPDRFIRFEFNNSKVWKRLMHEPFEDPVTCMCVSADAYTLFAGCESGLIWCASIKIDNLELKFESEVKIVPYCRLPCHHKRVNVLASCRAYSIFVSGSEDCRAAIWDSNRNRYVREIQVSGPVKNVTISETLGDIALVYETQENASIVAAYTINGDIIGKWESPNGSKVTSLTYSNAPEGISINLIVAGLSSGNLVTLDSWLIQQCREMNIAEAHGPVIALAYRNDAQILYVSYEDGWLIAMGPKELNGDVKAFYPMAVEPKNLPGSSNSRNVQKLTTIT